MPLQACLFFYVLQHVLRFFLVQSFVESKKYSTFACRICQSRGVNEDLGPMI